VKREEAIEIITGLKGEAITVTTMRGVTGWPRTEAATRFHFDNIGFMGGAAALGLGLALAQPERQVIVVDGDGSLLMQLGVLASIAGQAPRNLHHLVLVNRVYETSGGQPIPGAGRVDFAALAQAAGYALATAVSDASVLAERLPGLLSRSGPVFVAIETDPDTAEIAPPRLDAASDPTGRLRVELAG
jgi:phosphonopyruvate decarboxylase